MYSLALPSLSGSASAYLLVKSRGKRKTNGSMWLINDDLQTTFASNFYFAH